MSSYIAKKGYAMAILLLVVGGIAWGFMAASKGVNPVAKVFGKRAWIIYGLVGVAAVLVLFAGRNAFLPFLGPTIFPCAALEERTPEGADTTVKVHTQPGAKVVYWAAEPQNEDLKEVKDWRGAYAGFKNVGVATADESGLALLQVRKPQPYTVPLMKHLNSHVHYRVCLPEGELDEVKTVFLERETAAILSPVGEEEGFQATGTAVGVPAPVSAPPTPVSAPPAPVSAPTVKPLPATPLPAPPTPAVPTPVATPKPQQNASAPAPTVGAESPTKPKAGPEGFTSDILYGNAAPSSHGVVALTSTVEAVDPRVARLRTTVESEVIQSVDENAYDPLPPYEGTDLDAAFKGT
jgi:uncharacterized membrane protein YuzA (DUF378 family)